MYTAETLNGMIQNWKLLSIPKAELVVKAAEAAMEYPYVWGATGQECNPTKRNYFANRDACPEAESRVIREKCQRLRANNPKSTCVGCKYYPGGPVLIYDCQGFVKWVMRQVGIVLSGGGCTSMWNNNANWDGKGVLADMPTDKVCLVFMQSPKDHKTMNHVGLHIGNGQVIECSGEVKRSTTSAKGWTHYAMVKGLDGSTPMPATKPTLRRGSTGPYVVECQTDLVSLGYDIGKSGIDGVYGKATMSAVASFQTSKGLKPDGICGPATWAAIDEAVGPKPGLEPAKLYSVLIPHLTEEQANALCAEYAGATKTKE